MKVETIFATGIAACILGLALGTTFWQQDRKASVAPFPELSAHEQEEQSGRPKADLLFASDETERAPDLEEVFEPKATQPEAEIEQERKLATPADLSEWFKMPELARLASESPDIAEAARKAALMLDAELTVVGYFHREWKRILDGTPSIPLSEELRAVFDPMPDSLYLALEKTDQCVRQHLAKHDLDHGDTIWVVGPCGEDELTETFAKMAREALEKAIAEHGG